MTMSGNPATRRIASLFAAGAIALGAMTLATTNANAEPISEDTIKSECKDAGGSYHTSVEGGNRNSSCIYADSDGDIYWDDYVNGEYTGTSGPLREAPPTKGATPPSVVNPGVLAPNEGQTNSPAAPPPSFVNPGLAPR